MLTTVTAAGASRLDARVLSTPQTPIVVRHAEPGDSEALHGIYTDPGVMSWLVDVPYLPAAHTRKQVEDAVAGRYILVACMRERIVGAIGLASYASPRMRHVGRLGPVAVSRAAQGLGIGTAMMRAACDLADDWLNVVRLELIVFAENHRAIALYRKFGFEIEGTARALCFQAGRYVDVHNMARIRLPGGA